jgi:kinesin family protein 15
MVLVDVAHGKLRHVPYRDSRLTFLLQVICNSFSSAVFSFMFLGHDVRLGKKMQDSLGGNSKTMIIANVSPSIWLVHRL